MQQNSRNSAKGCDGLETSAVFMNLPFRCLQIKDEAQTALFKDPVRTAQ